MKISIKSILTENFKGRKSNEPVVFGKITRIFGANAAGKTTLFDAFTWLLFNKDSLGNEKFNIRPLDADGNQIDNVNIKVCATLEVDNKQVDFEKVQKQNWVKKRGTSETTLQGNVNSYEIDGYPKSEKDYKAYIGDIVSEELFKILTSPTYFTSLKWKEQRDILMRFIDEVSDYELASENSEFKDLLNELQKAPSTDDIQKKYQKALTEWKKKQSELPTRIDEVERQKVNIDVAELELGKKAILELLSTNQAKQEDATKQYEEYQNLSDGIMELKFAQTDLERKANEEIIMAKSENIKRQNELHVHITDLKHQIVYNNSDIEKAEKAIARNQAEIEICKKRWVAENERVFDENSLVCSYCGQEYPSERKEQLKADFKAHKAKCLEEITTTGNNLKASIEKDKSEIEQLKATLLENENAKKKFEDELARLESVQFPNNIDISETDEYKKIQEQIEEKEKLIKQGNSVDEIRKELKHEEFELRLQLSHFEREIARADINVTLDERIEELQAEQREVAQKVADQEKMLYLLEEFIRYKMDKVSNMINSKFEDVNFKLFENQINGGLKECCECTVNGVPFGSLNNGHRIVAGLQIIKSLQGLYGVSAPIFIDNAESINEYNLPDMDCQLILLTVSDDKKLRIEVA